jgi:hypothetical protein
MLLRLFYYENHRFADFAEKCKPFGSASAISGEYPKLDIR